MTQRRLPPTQRREQIVGAARSLIVKQGLPAVSLRDIAAAAGVSMGTVTYHFSGIDEILGEVVVAESERFYADVVAVADAERVRYWEACCTRVIERGVRDGTLRPVEPAAAALKLSAYADGLGAQLGQEAPGLTAALARAWMDEFTALLLFDDPA